MIKDFSEFRKLFAQAIRNAGGPEEMAEMVGDLDDEGGAIFEPLWNVWQNVEDGDEDISIHDAVFDMFSAMSNSMNFEPGGKPQLRGHRPQELAPKIDQEFAKLIDSSFSMSPEHKEEATIRGLLDVVTEVLEMLQKTGVVSNIETDYAGRVVTYRVKMSDYLEELEDEMTKAEFTPSQNHDVVDTWFDNHSNLQVTFNDGRATVSKRNMHEHVIKITVGQLKKIIQEASRKPKKSVVRAKKPESGAQLMSRVVAALKPLGLTHMSQEKNHGVRRVWFDFKTPSTVQGQRADEVGQALNSAGLTVTSDRSKWSTPNGTHWKNNAFEVWVTDDKGKSDIGKDILISVYDGPRAEQERMGLDTGDMGEPMPGEPLR